VADVAHARWHQPLVRGGRYWKVDKPASGTDPWSMTYPATPPNLLPGTPAVLKALGGCLIAIVVAAVGVVAFIFVEFWLGFHASDAAAGKAQHNTDLLFRAFTGQVPDSVSGGSGATGPEARAIKPLQGHPTPRDEMPKAIAAFTATGYTPMLETAPGESWCSLDTDPPIAYLPGTAPLTVRVTCTWRAQRTPNSRAGIAIEGAVLTADVRQTLGGRGYFVANAGLIMDAPLYNAIVVVSASQ
jgi:hypothetical protein